MFTPHLKERCKTCSSDTSFSAQSTGSIATLLLARAVVDYTLFAGRVPPSVRRLVGLGELHSAYRSITSSYRRRVD